LIEILCENVYGDLPELELSNREIVIKLPEGEGPFPVFVGLNFGENKPWPLQQITDKGFAIATSDYQDWYPDDPHKAPQTGPRAISTWAAALSAIRKVVAAQPGIDPNRVIAIGHSRLGKAALWAAANDPAFSACVAIQSGCGGAAPNLIQPDEEGAERIGDITAMFPHWFADTYAGWAGREHEMPFDQHWLLAAIAPRPVLLLNAEEDLWANPKGQERMAQASGHPNIQTHTRPGKHEVLPEDWERAISFLFR
jgi:dienelactone hydrolase